MAELMPPLILELRARATGLMSTLGEVKTAVKDTADTTEAHTSRASGAFDKMAGAGKVMAIGIAGAAVTVGGSALKMGMDFQESMTTLVTGAGESQKNIGMVGDGILGMSGKVGQSSQALSSGMYLIESAGYHAADGLKVLNAAAEGAKVGNADMKTVADGLTTTLTDYHLKASDAATVTSKLVTTVASGKTTMGDLAGSLSTVLPTASAAKIGLDQVLGAMATMTGQGISAQQASNNLASTIGSLSNPSQVASKAMAQIGINSTDLASNLGKKGLTGTLDQVYQAIIHNMGPSGLVLENSFNQSKLAAQSAKSMIDGLPKSLQKMAQGYLDGTVTQKQWTSELKGQPATVANLGKQFATVAKQSTGFSDALKSGSGDAKTFNATLSEVMGGSTGLNTALALTGGNMATFQANVKGIGKASAESDGSVKGFAETQKDLKTKLENAKDGAEAMVTSLGMKMIPVVTRVLDTATKWGTWLVNHKPVLIAVAAVIGGVVVTAIGAYIASLVKAQIETVAKLGLMVAGWLGYSAESSAAAAEGAAASEASILGQFATMVGTAVTGFASMIAAGATWVAQQAVQAAEGVAAGAVWLAEHVVMWAAAAAGYAATAAAATAAFIAENAATLGIVAVIGLLVAAIVWLATHWSEAWDAIKTAAQWAYDNVIKPVGDWIQNNVLQPIGSTVSWLGDVWSKIWGGIRKVIQDVGKIIGDILGGIVGGIQSVVGWIQKAISWFTSLFDSANSSTSASQKAINAAAKVPAGASAAGAVAGSLGNLKYVLPHKDVGGWINEVGPGKPLQMVGHGGEYVLSQDMLASRQKIDPQVAAAVAANAGPSMSQQALTTGSGPGGRAAATQVTVNAHTNASPAAIASQIGWVLQGM